MEIDVVYSYKSKSGESGIGQIFYNVSLFPLTMQDILDIEQRIRENNNFEAVIITNVIRLADDDTRG